MNPIGRTLKWFVLNGVPIRKLTPDMIPQAYIEGEWKPLYDIGSFLSEAVPVSEESFNRLVSDSKRR